MTKEHEYYDADGNVCSLDTLCRREPAWAANVIRGRQAQVAVLWRALQELVHVVEDEWQHGPECECFGPEDDRVEDAQCDCSVAEALDESLAALSENSGNNLLVRLGRMESALQAALSWRGLDGHGITDPVRVQIVDALAREEVFRHNYDT